MVRLKRSLISENANFERDRVGYHLICSVGRGGLAIFYKRVQNRKCSPWIFYSPKSFDVLTNILWCMIKNLRKLESLSPRGSTYNRPTNSALIQGFSITVHWPP